MPIIRGNSGFGYRDAVVSLVEVKVWPIMFPKGNQVEVEQRE